MESQLKRGVLELCVFTVLSREDCYGYKLVQIISDNIEISEGTIYPLLKRLKDDGMVSTYLAESREGPPRKFYHITEKGKLEMEIQKKEYRDFIKKVNRILEEDL